MARVRTDEKRREIVLTETDNAMWGLLDLKDGRGERTVFFVLPRSVEAEQKGLYGGAKLWQVPFVLGHEYGHHVQNLLGTSSQVAPGESGPTSGTVRLELQADCYAGAWANHAETVPDESGQPLIADITDDDIARALDAAGRIGDDFIQTELGSGQVDESAFTHGTSEQRQRWFLTGYETGDPAQCDTFATDDLG